MLRSNTDVEVAILGAGPAGAAAALELARAGRRVLLIDKHAFPREKVCGGCLSGSGTTRLFKLLGPARRPPGLPTARATFIIGPHRFVCRPKGAAWMVARAELDACLVEAAVAAGAMTRFGEAATLELNADEDCWDVFVGTERIRAAVVLLAAGIGGLLRKVGITGRGTGRPMLAQQWVQPALPPLPRWGETEMHWLRGGYIGVATSRPDQCVVALVALASATPGETAFERLRKLNPDAPLIQALPSDAPRRFGARGTAGFPWLPERLGDRNLLLIGDAAGYAEPYSGEGIGQAFCSASCAAQAVVSCTARESLPRAAGGRSHPPGGALLHSYSGFMRRAGHQRVFWRTLLLGRLLKRNFVHALARAWPWLPHGLFSRLVARVHVGPYPAPALRAAADCV